MMKNIFIIAYLFVTALTYSQNGPKISFSATDNTIDYGKVYKDVDSGVRTFLFTNTGNEPLIINNVRSSCGCTIPSKPDAPILPGKQGKIDVQYNMAIGIINKAITVESNAVNVPDGNVLLKLKGEVLVKEVNNPLKKDKPLMGL